MGSPGAEDDLHADLLCGTEQNVVILFISNLEALGLVTAGPSSFPGPGRHLSLCWNQLPVISINRGRRTRM